MFGLVSQMGLVPVFVDRNSTVNGVSARHFTFTATWTQARRVCFFVARSSAPALTDLWCAQDMNDDAIANNESSATVGTEVFVVHYYDDAVTHYPLRLVSKTTQLSLPDLVADITSFTPSNTAGALTWTGPKANATGYFDSTECPSSTAFAISGPSLYPATTTNVRTAATSSSSDMVSSAGRRLSGVDDRPGELGNVSLRTSQSASGAACYPPIGFPPACPDYSQYPDRGAVLGNCLFGAEFCPTGEFFIAVQSPDMYSKLVHGEVEVILALLPTPQVTATGCVVFGPTYATVRARCGAPRLLPPALRAPPRRSHAAASVVLRSGLWISCLSMLCSRCCIDASCVVSLRSGKNGSRKPAVRPLRPSCPHTHACAVGLLTRRLFARHVAVAIFFWHGGKNKAREICKELVPSLELCADVNNVSAGGLAQISLIVASLQFQVGKFFAGTKKGVTQVAIQFAINLGVWRDTLTLYSHNFGG